MDQTSNLLKNSETPESTSPYSIGFKKDGSLDFRLVPSGSALKATATVVVAGFASLYSVGLFEKNDPESPTGKSHFVNLASWEIQNQNGPPGRGRAGTLLPEVNTAITKLLFEQYRAEVNKLATAANEFSS